VKPGESLGTAGIFSHPDLARDTEPATLAGSVAQLNAQHDNGNAFGRNDLQPVAQALCPPIAQVANWLQARFGNSRMTGSGSAVFATVGADAGSWLEGDVPDGWNARMCQSLAQHPLKGWAD